jgi:hypothetical protein
MTRFSVMYRGFGTMLRRARSAVVMVGRIPASTGCWPISAAASRTFP